MTFLQIIENNMPKKRTYLVNIDNILMIKHHFFDVQGKLDNERSITFILKDHCILDFHFNEKNAQNFEALLLHINDAIRLAAHMGVMQTITIPSWEN